METTPLFDHESLNENTETVDDSPEAVGEERRNELAVELGGIANPLMGDVDFSAADNDDEDDE